MSPIRLTPRQARRYAFARDTEPTKAYSKKPRQSAQVTRRSEKEAVAVSVAVGEKYRVQRRLDRDHPPPVGTLCVVWLVGVRRVFLHSQQKGYYFDVGREELATYFVREEEAQAR